MSKPNNLKFSDTIKVLLLFDLTMSYVMAVRSEKLKFRMKQIFNMFDKTGTSLWNHVIKQLKADDKENDFDNYVIEMNEVVTLYFDSPDRHTLLALMRAHNQGEVTVTETKEQVS